MDHLLRYRLIHFTLIVFFAASGFASAALHVPALFSDHMVLQSSKETAFWGSGDVGGKVTVVFFDETGTSAAEASASVGADGKWKLHLPPLAAGTSGAVEIRQDSGEAIRIEDVVAGEVWLGSGQSNMEYQTAAANVPREISAVAVEGAGASTPSIRFFTVVKKSGAPNPVEEVEGQWVVVTPDNVGKLSATGWYFAHALWENLQVPVGMIISCWGGTPVEAWMSKEMLDSTQASRQIWDRHNKLLASYTPEKVKQLQDAMKAWQKANPTPELQRKNRASKPQYPYWATSSRVPVRLYNGMLHGLIPYTLQGVIWYQGEANASRPGIYGELIQAMVKGWREAWGEELPFYYVELAAHMKAQETPVQEPSWAFIREGQADILQLPKTGVATAVDVGLADDVHPPYKKIVGQRLAGLALRDVHGREGQVESPQFADFKISGSEVRIMLKNAEGLRVKDGGEVKGFAICGPDRQWKWAQAKVEGEDVIVWNEDISQPAAVRYAWADNPVISLVNEAGLPLRSFRTDRDAPMP